MKCAVQDLVLTPVHYIQDGKACEGTNVTYQLRGKRMSSRWPWRQTCHAAATKHILQTPSRYAWRRSPGGPTGPNLRPV